jgi:hypothetical protein
MNVTVTARQTPTQDISAYEIPTTSWRQTYAPYVFDVMNL